MSSGFQEALAGRIRLSWLPEFSGGLFLLGFCLASSGTPWVFSLVFAKRPPAVPGFYAGHPPTLPRLLQGILRPSVGFCRACSGPLRGFARHPPTLP